MDRVLAAAEHLRSEGKYSDGVGRTERIYVAGHSVWRLSDEFVNAPQIVGNDEQYAATMALIANDIGVPARVVLGAVVPEGGRVTGKDVSAWVELRAADGSWRTLPTERFMSDDAAGRPGPRDQHPDVRHGHPAAQPDPAAVRRGGAERRRPQGAQGHPQEGRRGRGRPDRRPPGVGRASW